MLTEKEKEELFEALRQLKEEIIAEVEDRLENYGGDGRAKLKLVEHLYNTDDEHILELSNVSGLQVRPIAIVETLEHIGDPDVKRGKKSLAGIYVNNILRVRRSVDSMHLARGNRLAGEQLSAESEEEYAGEPTELGREK